MTSEDFRMALAAERADAEREERNARWLSPDCRDGKCAPCTGPAWDEDEDCLTVCACGCHEDGAA